MTKIITALKARRDAAKTEGGFSLIDLVVSVAIVIALSVGGFVAYGDLLTQSKVAALTGAADQVRTAAVVAENDGLDSTTVGGVITTFNDSNDSITATLGAAPNDNTIVLEHDGLTGAAATQTVTFK